MKKIKICLDAGHYAKYNSSPVNKAYWESKMTWKLTNLQKKYLEGYGFEVILTRADQSKDLSLKERGQKAKGCDLFISNHSNACEDANVDFPFIIVPINGTGHDLGKLLGACISETMGTAQDAVCRSVKSTGGDWDYYGVIFWSNKVGVTGIILEHSFHTNRRATEWLLNGDNLDKLAKAEARVIAEYYGMTAKEAETELKKGDIVSIASNAKYYNGANMPSWVKAKKWILKADPVGDRAVIDKSEDGANSINSAVNVKYLTKIETTEADKVITWATANGLITSETDLDKAVTLRAVITMLYRVYNGK